jgi:hypothetical protein
VCELDGPSTLLPDVETRLSRALKSHLSDSLRSALSRWLDRDDDGLWVVRRLELELIVGAEVPADVLAAAISARVGRELGTSLRGDGDGVNAIRFPNRAAYLARLVDDLARGEAWSRWYHEPFAGLRMLPASAAIRTALGERPASGLLALQLLDEAALGRVCSVVSAADEALLLAVFSGLSLPDAASSAHDAPGSAPQAAAEDAASWSGGHSDGLGSVAHSVWLAYRRAIRRGIGAGRRLFALVTASTSAGTGEAAGVECVHRVFTGWEQAGPRALRELTALLEREGALPPQLVRPEDAVLLSPKLLRAMHAELVGEPEVAVDTPDGVSRRTRFGGLWLLLRDLEALPWLEWTADWPPFEAGAATTLQWLTLAACAGRDQAPAVLADPALRDLFGVSPRRSVAEVASWLRSVGSHRRARLQVFDVADAGVKEESPPSALRLPGQFGFSRAWRRALGQLARRVLTAFARRLPGFAESSPEHLLENFLSFDATLDYEEERVVVRCGRPPLHLILTLTGMTRGTTAGRDLRRRAIVLYSE